MDPAVLAERDLLEQQAQNVKPAVALLGSDSEAAADEEKTEGEQEEEKRPNPGDGAVRHLRQLEHTCGEPAHVDLSPEVMMPSMKLMQRGAWSLLRFLVAVSMRQASLAGVAESETSGLEGPPDDRRNGAEGVSQGAREGVREGLLDPKAEGRARGVGRKKVAAVVGLRPPTRERSMYGTPFKQMQTHVDNLHQVKIETQYFVNLPDSLTFPAFELPLLPTWKMTSSSKLWLKNEVAHCRCAQNEILSYKRV